MKLVDFILKNGYFSFLMCYYAVVAIVLWGMAFYWYPTKLTAIGFGLWIVTLFLGCMFVLTRQGSTDAADSANTPDNH